jgi:hypothetical protein
MAEEVTYEKYGNPALSNFRLIPPTDYSNSFHIPCLGG